jgi:hypothetical protein
VAVRAAGAHAHIGMELGWCPGRVALVASRAIGAGADVIDPFACRLGTIVTTCADGC